MLSVCPHRPSRFGHRRSATDSTHLLPACRDTLFITGDTAPDDLLNVDPLALRVGMLSDQQVR
jgi:hypothetical protein